MRKANRNLFEVMTVQKDDGSWAAWMEGQEHPLMAPTERGALMKSVEQLLDDLREGRMKVVEDTENPVAVINVPNELLD